METHFTETVTLKFTPNIPFFEIFKKYWDKYLKS